MEIFKCETIDEAYRRMIERLKYFSNRVGNTREIENAIIQINRPSLENITFPFRVISENYSNAELKWYWSADNSCETIGKHAKLWLRLSDDGKTNNSAYGYILHKKYGFDQLQQIVEVLRKDPNSRRAVLNISDPTIDRVNTKDMQCTVAVQFLLRNNKLNTTVTMRSNDVIFGFPYDYIYFMTLTKYVAEKLNVEVGTYTHQAISLHLYEKDIDKLVEHNQIITVPYEKIIEENYEAKK